MSEHFPDGTLEKIRSALRPIEQKKNDLRSEEENTSGSILSQIIVDHSVHKANTVSPEMTIGILQAYLKAVAVFPVAEGVTVADLLKENDHKLWFALQTAGVEIEAAPLPESGEKPEPVFAHQSMGGEVPVPFFQGEKPGRADERCSGCGAPLGEHADTGVEPGSMVCPMRWEEMRGEITALRAMLVAEGHHQDCPAIHLASVDCIPGQCAAKTSEFPPVGNPAPSPETNFQTLLRKRRGAILNAVDAIERRAPDVAGLKEPIDLIRKALEGLEATPSPEAEKLLDAYEKAIIEREKATHKGMLASYRDTKHESVVAARAALLAAHPKKDEPDERAQNNSHGP